MFDARSAKPALFALPRLATSFITTAILTLGLPVMLASAGAGDRVTLGTVTAIAALAGIAALLVTGWHIDRHRAERGRKRYPLYGLALSLPALVALALRAPDYATLFAAAISLVVARSISEAAHLPILAEDPGGAHPGRFAGMLALYQFIGAGLGALAFGAHWHPAPVAIALVLIAMVGFWQSYRERGRGPAEAGPYDSNEQSRVHFSAPIVNLFAARTCFLAAIFIVSTFLVYLVRDVLGATDVQRTTATLYGFGLIGALAAAVPAGTLSARLGERRILFTAGAAVGLAVAAIVAFGRTSPAIAIAAMIIYGAAFSAVVASGLSLMVQLVPRPEHAGRLMSVATATMFLSQALASAAGALAQNYWQLAGAVEIFLILGGVFLARVSKSRPEDLKA